MEIFWFLEEFVLHLELFFIMWGIWSKTIFIRYHGSIFLDFWILLRLLFNASKWIAYLSTVSLMLRSFLPPIFVKSIQKLLHPKS